MSTVAGFQERQFNPWLQAAVNQLFSIKSHKVEQNVPLTGCVSQLSLPEHQELELVAASHAVLPRCSRLALAVHQVSESQGCVEAELLSEMSVSAIMDEMLYAQLDVAESH